MCRRCASLFRASHCGWAFGRAGPDSARYEGREGTGVAVDAATTTVRRYGAPRRARCNRNDSQADPRSAVSHRRSGFRRRGRTCSNTAPMDLQNRLGRSRCSAQLAETRDGSSICLIFKTNPRSTARARPCGPRHRSVRRGKGVVDACLDRGRRGGRTAVSGSGRSRRSTPTWRRCLRGSPASSTTTGRCSWSASRSCPRRRCTSTSTPSSRRWICRPSDRTCSTYSSIWTAIPRRSTGNGAPEETSNPDHYFVFRGLQLHDQGQILPLRPAGAAQKYSLELAELVAADVRLI